MSVRSAGSSERVGAWEHSPGLPLSHSNLRGPGGHFHPLLWSVRLSLLAEEVTGTGRTKKLTPRLSPLFTDFPSKPFPSPRASVSTTLVLAPAPPLQATPPTTRPRPQRPLLPEVPCPGLSGGSQGDSPAPGSCCAATVGWCQSWQRSLCRTRLNTWAALHDYHELDKAPVAPQQGKLPRGSSLISTKVGRLFHSVSCHPYPHGVHGPSAAPGTIQL